MNTWLFTEELIAAETVGYRKAIADLRRADRLNEQLWQANTAARDSCYRIAADELERQLSVLETHLLKENE